jgi:hypothetical protein
VALTTPKSGKSRRVDIRIHDLGHTYATWRIFKGDNILDVSKQLGHHSLKITLDTYAHRMPGGKKSEVDELDGQQAPRIDEGQDRAEVATGEYDKKFCSQMHPLFGQWVIFNKKRLREFL